MATSGSFEAKIKDGADLLGLDAWGKFEWTRTSYSQTNNTSTISWSVYLKEAWGTHTSGAYRKIRVSIDGKSTDYITVTDGGKSGEFFLLGTYSTTITHTTDGSKTFSVSVTISSNSYGSSSAAQSGAMGGYSAFSGSGVLDSIVRPATISTASNFADEDNPTITYSNPSGTAVTSLQACIANSTGNTIYVAYRDISKTGSSYTFNLTTAERAALRTAAASSSTLSVRFYVKTVASGETFYRHLSRTMTVTGSLMPTVNPVVKDTNSTTVALTGNESILIPGYSNAYYNIGAAAQKGATVQSQSVTCGAIVKTTATGTFTAVPNYEFTFYCRDTRGNYIYQPYEADHIPYFKVTCNQTVRLNLDGTADLHITGNYFDGSFGKVDNTLSVQVRHREDGGAWGAWATLDPLISDISNDTYTLTATISGYDASGTHEFQARAIDKLHTAYSGEESVVLTPIFDWSRTDFNFNVPLTIQGSPLADFVIDTGTTAMGTNGTWYWRKWKSGRAECYGRRNYGTMAVTTGWGGLFRSESFTQSLPSGLFTAAPEAIDISLSSADFGGWICKHETSNPTASSTGGFIVVRPASATLSQAYIGFNVIGRWK